MANSIIMLACPRSASCTADDPPSDRHTQEGLADEIAAADLVISHAGAGSIIEALQASRHLLVVVNTDLADNHQIELAQALAARGHLEYAASPGEVVEVSPSWPLPFCPPAFFALFTARCVYGGT